MCENGPWRIGFDIGGTFTDFVLVNDGSGEVRLHKRLTTAEDPSEAAICGLAEICCDAGISLADVSELIHGTTLVTNAIIERDGARVGLLTTSGFRDLLEMGTEQRYDIYDLFLQFPEPLVPRHLRLEVDERMDCVGEPVRPLDEDSVCAALQKLQNAGVEAVAICFLHAYQNDANERRARDIIARHAPGLPVSISSEVVAEVREYQRLVTTCANAYVQPLMEQYLAKLEKRLAEGGFAGRLTIMHSAGGLVSLETAVRLPIRLLESGPAGGGLAAAFFGTAAEKPDLLAFDMGGTTAKSCLIENGAPAVAQVMEAGRVHRFTPGSGLPIRTPVIDMIEIGGGGGSVAMIDEVGLLKVGPRSAGSSPGPACYARGGKEPTVTDANLVLGYYDPDFFLGGQMALRPDMANTALAKLALDLGIGVEHAAYGIHRLVNENMAAAVRAHAVERARDPRSLSIVAFGGAGPAHAAGVARILGVAEVVVPPASGAASAVGFLTAAHSFEAARSVPMRVSEGGGAAIIEGILESLENEARHHLESAGLHGSAVTVSRSADMRLVGQMHEISVLLPSNIGDAGAMRALHTSFLQQYAKRFAPPPLDAEVEIVHVRVTCNGPSPRLAVRQPQTRHGKSSRKGNRSIWNGTGWVEADVHDRYALRAGDQIEGPAIIEEHESTTIVPTGDRLWVDDQFNLRIIISAIRSASMPAADGNKVMPLEKLENDPVGLEIMWSRLASISEEMWLTVCRTAYSLIVSEAQDFACELLDCRGETLAHSRRGMPVFNLTLPRAVKALLKRFPAETLKPGDVLITNDPWLCAGHLPDIAIVTPIFRGGVVVGLAGTVGHVSDIGGTKDSLWAREIYDEGLQIPPMKLIDAGTPNNTLLELIATNVRGDAQVVGDLYAFMGANAVGERQLLSFMDEYGLDDLSELAAILQGKSETAMRVAISALPDGRYSADTWANPLGEPIRLPLEFEIAGDGIDISFPDAPPALDRGGLNCTLNYTAAHATYPLKCILTPNVRGNAGCYRPLGVSAPSGTIFNAPQHASVNVRTRIGWYIGPSIYSVMSKLVPEKVQAFTGLPMSLTVYGQSPEGTFSDVFLLGGGQGASSGSDGVSGLIFPSSAANTSIEVFESRVPILVLEKTFIADSGGAGQHRGGLAQRIVLAKRKSDGLPVRVSIFPEGVGLEADGLFGGQPGASAYGRILRADGSVIRNCGTGELVALSEPDERLEAVLTGGSGYGPVENRPTMAIERDIANGYLSRRAARRIYGYREKTHAERKKER